MHGKVRVVHLDYAPPGGARAYYFLKIAPHKEEALFRAMRGSAPLDLEAYGDILASGYGEPSPDLLAEMRRRYHLAAEE